MKKHVIGIDIGGTMIKGALFNSGGSLVKKKETDSLADQSETVFISNLVSFINSITPENVSIESVGIGIAGVLDKKRTTVVESPNIPGLRRFNLKKNLQSRLNIPVGIENDANIAALGELWAGNGKETANFMLITIGTGIGSGLIINGSLWTGETGKAAEFGHIIVHTDGAPCTCGKKGCLEAYSSGTAMVRIAKEALEKGRKSSLQNVYNKGPGLITPKLIYNKAKKGDLLSLEIFSVAARNLATGISNINNILDIHTFIIGGGVAGSSDIFLPELITETRKKVFGSSKRKINITISKLGNNAGIFGAAFLALQSAG